MPHTHTSHTSQALEFQPPVFESEDYRFLVGHRRTDGAFKTDEQLRAEYIHRTDGLIALMTDGVEVMDIAKRERRVEKPDYVVWLDKSARPVAWLTKELWPKLAPNPGETEVPKMPKFRFVNIDRQQWINTVDPSGTGYVDINQVSPTIIRSLRSIFVEPKYKRHGLTSEIDKAPAELDDKTVLIIDEVMATGRTLDIARQFFGRAFPTARIATAHWMGGIAQVGQAIGNADLPVWYQEKNEKGRGVANRNEVSSQRSASLTQQLGNWFLSTRFPELDPDSSILRKEIKRLAHDDDVLVIPSYQRDDFIERVESINGIEFEEYKKRKLALGEAKVLKK